MSFERFSSSDVYIYEDVGGYIQCYSPGISDSLDGNLLSVQLKTPREALLHLDKLEKSGLDIGAARVRIEKEYPDLDVKIEPYKQDPEVLERIKQKIKEAMERSEE